MDILLVEDNQADACLLTEIFEKKDKSTRIQWVLDGYQALDYVFQRQPYQDSSLPDMIMLDLNLPRVSGYEVLKEIKHHPSLATIPIIILTTSPDPLDHSQCKALGADICLSKPNGLKAYEDMVQRVINWASLRVSKPLVPTLSSHD